MNFQDRSQTSVQSLLALLRSAQDDGDRGGGEPGPSSTAAAAAGRARASDSTVHVSASSTNVTTQTRPAPASTQHASSSRQGEQAAQAQGGRNTQLSALLAQLAPSLPPTPSASGSSASTPAQPTQKRGSAFEGPTHGLIEPFGPVGQTPGVRRDSGGAAGSPAKAASGGRDGSASSSREESAPRREPTAADKGKRKADEMEDRADWAFTRCLPVLTDLLRDDEFVKEVRKMKKDQDALERRLWARMEKVKAEHTAKQAPERQIAKITRKPVPAEKEAQWKRELQRALDELFVTHVLPSLDGLETRQVARLAELGVPGLGSVPAKGKRSEDTRARQVRVRRIMGVLEGVLDG